MSDQPLVVFPLYQGCTLLDFGGATQVFAFAGLTTVWAAERIEPVTTTEGVQVMPSRTFESLGGVPIEILFVPGGGAEVAAVMTKHPAFLAFLRDAGPRAAWAGSVCTGAFLLAAAGLLDGFEATTYWSQLPNLALFPRVTVSAGYPRWTIEGNRFTGGGVSSSIDLALELVRRRSGDDASRTAQLEVQYAPSPPFASGDPSQAPPEIVAAVRQSQEPFTAAMRRATEEVISG